MKDQVKFMNEKNEEFFVCSAAEARIAMEAIKNKRLKIDPAELETNELKSDIERVFDIASKMTPVEMPYSKASGDSMTAYDICDLTTETMKEDYFVSYVIMNAKSYQCLIKHDRDSIDINAIGTLDKMGYPAKIWGSCIVIRKVPNDTLYTVSSKRDNGYDHDMIKAFHLNPVEREKTEQEKLNDRLEKIEEVLQILLEKA